MIHQAEPKTLLLVDFENVQRLDMSALDESYRAIVFIGALQNPPRAARLPATAHRFSRVEFQHVEGTGRNALDFHIACHLGRMFETERDTTCIVVSKDKGYDPLLLHLNRNGLKCRRIEDMADLKPTKVEPVCRWCRKSSTIELHGGLWCSNCARFATPPDPALLPSRQPGYRAPDPERSEHAWSSRTASRLVCGWCSTAGDMVGGIYDDGEWMCGSCIARYAD
ncbi:PIN domain-containing protein [Sphaerotilaceae bacterium SBD11-9]